MRWNSTKTYTEDDMLRMQQEAVSRVHEFQTRAQQTLPFYDVPDSAITPYTDSNSQLLYASQNALPYSTQLSGGDMPAGYAGGEQPLPDSQNQQSEQSDGQNALMQASQAQSHSQPSILPEPIKGLLDKLDIDSEVLLIMGLLFLLYNEKADSSLLLALGYLIL